MNETRRTLLKGTLAGSGIALALGSGLMAPGRVMAAWPQSAFKAENMSSAMQGILGTEANEPSDKIAIKAPDIAENGAVVPVTISANLPGAEAISLLVEGNGTPLAASFTLGAGAAATVSTRIKMGKTSNVVALVKAGGKVYSARKEVKVTIGGCGG